MNERFGQTSFSIEMTSDGSPTLRNAFGGESMHHSGGAASETIYIYKNVIKNALKCNPEATTLVMGLGLGYIEISWAIEIANLGKLSPLNVNKLVSYEKDSNLLKEFSDWIFEKGRNNLYDKIFEKLNVENVDLSDVKNILNKNYNKIHFQNEFLIQNDPIIPANIICFDAFSSKTDSNLWTTEFFELFFKKYCAHDCVFTTYACTGVLKRSLIESGFTFIKRPGFTGKRDSTLAIRGEFVTFEKLFRTF